MILNYFQVTFTYSDESGSGRTASDSSDDDYESRATATGSTLEIVFAAIIQYHEVVFSGVARVPAPWGKKYSCTSLQQNLQS